MKLVLAPVLSEPFHRPTDEFQWSYRVEFSESEQTILDQILKLKDYKIDRDGRFPDFEKLIDYLNSNFADLRELSQIFHEKVPILAEAQ